jgi:hypothetical protein
MIQSNIGNLPSVFLPSPTSRDYERGYIDRYFVQKRHDGGSPIYEIHKNSFQSMGEHPFWNTVMVRWVITGEYETVRRLNTQSVIISSRKMPNISKYLQNTAQFIHRHASN